MIDADGAVVATLDEPLSDRVIREVRDRIISQMLPAGSSFTESEITAALGVSKSPVREALALLRRQGWVRVLPRSGYQVAPLTLHDAQNLMTVRAALEPEAAGLAAQRGARWPDQLDALRQYARAARKASGGRDPQTEHFRFHRRIGVLSGNSELERILSETLLKLQRYNHVQDSAGGVAELEHDHSELAAAIADGQVERARALAGEHAADAKQDLLNALISSDALLSAELGSAPPTSGKRRVS